jgi:hypothetical protein
VEDERNVADCSDDEEEKRASEDQDSEKGSNSEEGGGHFISCEVFGDFPPPAVSVLA